MGADITHSTMGDTLAGPQSEVIRNHAAFIWSVADLLRGDYKQSEYGRVILPFTVLRRLDCVLEPRHSLPGSPAGSSKSKGTSPGQSGGTMTMPRYSPVVRRAPSPVRNASA